MKRRTGSKVRPARIRLWPIVLLSALLGTSIAGCGKPPAANLQFVRLASEARPLWVGAYFLSQESALDGKSTADLIAKKDEYRNWPGVEDAYAFPLAPGTTEPIHLQPLDPRVRWILLVAESDEQDDCVLQKIAMGEDERISLVIDAEGHCLKVKRMK